MRAAAALFDDQGGLPATHHHRAIVEAIERRDAGAARAALLADISRAFDILRLELDAGAPADAPADAPAGACAR